MSMRAVLWAGIICVTVWTSSTVSSQAWQNSEPVPDWIWAPQHRAGHVPEISCYFRKTFRLPPTRRATLAIAADDQFRLYINGKLVGEGNAEQGIREFQVADRLRQGDNTLALRVTNRNGGTAGLALRMVAVTRKNEQRVVVTNESWKASLSTTLFWNRNSYSDSRWQSAKSIGTYTDFVAQQLAAKSERNGAQQPASPGQRTSPEQQAKPSEVAATAKSAKSDVTPPPSATPQRTLTRMPAAGDQLEIPREFELDHLAGHADVGSVTAITFDEFGQMIVAREDGQLWLLSDRDDDATLDTVRDYGHLTKTVQGLLAINGSLFVTGLGDEGLGLYRLTDTDRDGALDQSVRIVEFDGDNIEHGPHGITLGPDGLLYVMVGNHSPVSGQAAQSSPYRHAYEGDLLTPRFEDPGGHASGQQAPGGYILRTDLEGKRIELFAGGFRNAYDLAFNGTGELFTHDSDMESDRGTTWYRPTRVYHVPPGAEFGWRSGWAKWPNYYIDALPGVADTGRGSPTGMVVYDHDQFPLVYRQAIFSGDWSEGRIWVMACTDEGASCRVTPKPFVQGKPLNVTDLEVGPDGGLYFATGGRGTAGNVYRVSWKGPRGKTDSLQSRTSTPTINKALRHPQLNSSWARQEIAQIRQKLGSKWAPELQRAALDVARPDDERLQALQIMQWVGPKASVELLGELAGDRRVAVRRYVAMLLGLRKTNDAAAPLQQLMTDPDVLVRRRACESLVRSQQAADVERLKKLLVSEDRFESWAARKLLEATPPSQWQQQVLTTDDQRLFLVGATALLGEHPSVDMSRAVINRTIELMAGFINDKNFIDLLRVQQVALARAKIKPDSLPMLRQTMADEYPSSSVTINRELIRTLAYLQVDSIADRYIAELNREQPPEEKVHLAMHLTYLRKGWSTEQKLAVFQYLSSLEGSGNSLPGYLQNAAQQFGKRMNGTELAAALATGHQNPSSALAALLQMPKRLSEDQFEQIVGLDERLESSESEMARRVKVAVIAILARDGQERSTAYLRKVYDRDPERRVEAALGMASTQDAENWPYLVRSLTILDPADAKEMLTKLIEIREWPADADSYRQVLLVGQRLGDDGANQAVKLLERWQGYAPSAKEIAWEDALAAWKKWFVETYPDEPLPELNVEKVAAQWDDQALLKHLKRAEREELGSPEAGRLVFAKADCAKCHRFGSDGDSMGPELTGIARRFLKRELLDSILYPSKVISDQYAAKIVFTESGKTYTGIVAEAPDDSVTILQSNGTKLQLPKDEVDEMEPARISAMPEGLLNELTLQEITDLFAYLASDPDRVADARRESETR